MLFRAANLVTGITLTGMALTASRGGAAEPPTGFAVVELFTSEGCSSCPPADELLQRLDAWGEQNGQSVYALSFHVDYWNRLGWEDPYSTAGFRNRQRSYAAVAGERSVYTPQMVVNGRQGFVGSDAKLATAAVAAALGEPPAGTLVANALSSETGTVRFGYRSSGLGDAELSIALVQTEGTQDVARGENAGRTLRHVNIVRAFRSIDPDPSGAGQASIDRPGDLTGPTRLVIYAQDPRTRRVLAAA